MFRKKVYGESKLPACPICGRNAVARNSQGVPVCESHRAERIDNLKCACGSTLELRIGKWGPYGYCDSCGNVSWTKICELNLMAKEARPAGGRTINMTSEEVGVESFEKRPTAGKNREVTKRSDWVDERPSTRKPERAQKELTIRSDDPIYF